MDLKTREISGEQQSKGISRKPGGSRPATGHTLRISFGLRFTIDSDLRFAFRFSCFVLGL